jgi:hypothetical protein
VNSKLAFHKEATQRKEISAKIKLEGGRPVEVKIEYVHATGEPSLHVAWSGPGMGKQILTPNNNALGP